MVKITREQLKDAIDQHGNSFEADTAHLEASPPSRRARILRVPAEVVLRMFTAAHAQHETLCVPMFPQLPKDARVVAVHDNFQSRSFDFLVESEEFEPVEPWREFPVTPNPAIAMRRAYRRIEENDNDGD